MTADGYATQVAALLPRGRLWRAFRRTPILGAVLGAIGDTLARVDAAIGSLSREADPRTTLQLLAEWEASCGLPDGCLPGGGTVDQRRAAVVARLVAIGGSSAAYFVMLGQVYGYALTVEDVAPNRVRVHSAGAVPAVVFRAGSGRAGQRLVLYSNTQLECLINRLKPAHVQVDYVYGA